MRREPSSLPLCTAAGRARDKRRGFGFGDGVFFELHRGKVRNVDFIAADKAHAYPVGVPGLFITRFTPAVFVETVETISLPRDAKSERGDFDHSIDFEVRTNPIDLSTPPEVLIEFGPQVTSSGEQSNSSVYLPLSWSQPSRARTRHDGKRP